MSSLFKKGHDPRRGTGGKRQGAGRPKGSVNKMTAKERQKILDGGRSPLEIMVQIARWHFGRWAIEKRKSPKERDEDRLMAKADAAVDAASKAAPYVHPKFAAVQHSGPGGGPIQTVDLSKMSDDDLSRLEALLGPLANLGGDQSGEDEAEG